MDAFLFDKGPSISPSPAEVAEPAVDQLRLRVPERRQVEMHWRALDELLEPGHQARLVWTAVCELNLDHWLTQIKATKRSVGRNATDPRLLLALWIYATLRGVGSARELARLCKEHLAYEWLCGGVTVNHHMLSDFRSREGGWSELLTQIVGSLLAAKVVTIDRVAQDGMRVRAHAGKASFRRRTTLETCLDEARQQVETLRQLADESPDELSKRQVAARERAASERAERVADALRNCNELQAQRDANAGKSGRTSNMARASTSDPQARVMQFSDGGFRPAYNVQFATTTETGIIVGVDVTNEGTDSEQLPPMLEQVKRRYERVPAESLVDGGFASLEAIDAASTMGSTVYAPLKDERKQLSAGKDPYAAKKGDSAAIASWRARMGTAAAKRLYQLRCQTAEWVNAQARNRRLYQMPVRGLAKCRLIGLLYAITHNVLVGMKLRAEANYSG